MKKYLILLSIIISSSNLSAQNTTKVEVKHTIKKENNISYTPIIKESTAIPSTPELDFEFPIIEVDAKKVREDAEANQKRTLARRKQFMQKSDNQSQSTSIIGTPRGEVTIDKQCVGKELHIKNFAMYSDEKQELELKTGYIRIRIIDDGIYIYASEVDHETFWKTRSYDTYKDYHIFKGVATNKNLFGERNFSYVFSPKEKLIILTEDEDNPSTTTSTFIIDSINDFRYDCN